MNITYKNLDVLGVLYLISKGEHGFAYRIRLQKMTLLGKLEFGYPFSFDYQSYYYGPYSESLQGLIYALIQKGLVIEEETGFPSGSTYFSYKITEDGKKLLNDGINKKDLTLSKEKIDSLWDKYSSLSNNQIVSRAKEISGISSLHERK